MQQTLEDEIKLTSRFHHQNIVKVLGACFGDKDTIALIMELVEGGNLSQRIHSKSRRKMEYMEVLQVSLEIAHDPSTVIILWSAVVAIVTRQ